MNPFLTEKWRMTRVWVSTHGGWTRVGQFLIALVTLLHAFNPQFASFFNWIWAAIPVHMKEPLVGIAAFYAWTRDPKNKALVRQLWESYFQSIEREGVKTRETTTIVSALLISFLLLGSTGLAGCDDFERGTFKTLTASKALIDQAQMDYEAGTLPRDPATYELISNARQAQTVAVQAFQMLYRGSGYGHGGGRFCCQGRNSDEGGAGCIAACSQDSATLRRARGR